MTKANAPVRSCRNARARTLGRYPWVRAVVRIRSIVSGRIDRPGSPLSTLDTVDTCTPAALAMSTSRAALRVPAGPAWRGTDAAAGRGAAAPAGGFWARLTGPAGGAGCACSGRRSAVGHQHGAVDVTGR